MDPVLHQKLEALLPDHRLVSHEGIEPPELVIADVGRLDADEVADTYPDVPLLGVTSIGDANGLRRAQAAGFDEVVAKAVLLERAAELVGAQLRPVE